MRTIQTIDNIAHLDRSDLEIDFFCEPEDTPFVGNCMASGDEQVDKETEDYIRSELESGNEWAWCIVTVTAKIDDLPFVGRASLGACSYKGEMDFRRDHYFVELRDEAIADLNLQMSEARMLAAEIEAKR